MDDPTIIEPFTAIVYPVQALTFEDLATDVVGDLTFITRNESTGNEIPYTIGRSPEVTSQGNGRFTFRILLAAGDWLIFVRGRGEAQASSHRRFTVLPAPVDDPDAVAP